MYENMTFESILYSMLSRIPNTLDTREGSIVYNALAPAAYELAQAYFLLDNFLKLPFIDTSVEDFLTLICSQYGVNRKPATAAVKTGTFKDSSGKAFNVPIGSRFGINGIVYKATKLLSDGTFELTCETLGAQGNLPSGELLPIDNIVGLATATITAVLVAGADEESDDALKQRTLTKIQNPATSGSINDYKLWALSVSGVGGVKVFPTWNGNGTVKLILIGTDKKAVGEGIITTVSKYIEAVRPIGATVTVTAAQNLAINISVSITRASGYSIEQITGNITAAITKYLQSIAFVQASVSYAKIGNVILESEGVLDYTSLTVNGGTSNVPLSMTAASCQTPVIGMVVVT